MDFGKQTWNKHFDLNHCLDYNSGSIYLIKYSMKKWLISILAILLLGVGGWFYFNALNQSTTELPPTTAGEIFVVPVDIVGQEFTIEYMGTHSMTIGTHRPEILVNEDELFLLVVQPKEDVLHQGYAFDATDPSQIDFSNPTKSFTVSTVTDEYGKPADHRATIIGDELVVVYQTLVLPENTGRIEGPSEEYADSQSLMMVRLDLDGNMITTEELAQTTDFSEDNFPDMCIVPDENSENLLVSTGKAGGFKIREVNLNGEILETYTYETSRTTVPDSIGNSMFWGLSNELLMFSGIGPPDWDITVTDVNDYFDLGEMTAFTDSGDSTFPTGIVSFKGHYLVAYSSRDAGGDPAIETNPLSPRLMILDSSFNVQETLVISNEPGSGHVHPTMAIIGDRLFYAWSMSASNGEMNTPQVIIEEFQVI